MSASAPRLAPELDQTIEAAQAELGRAVQICSLNNDPLRHPLSALSMMLGALHQVSLNIGEQVAAARQPITDASLTRLEQAAASGAERRAGELARAQNWRIMAIGGGVLAAGLLIAGFGGYFAGYRHGGADALSAASDLRAVLGDSAPAAMTWRDLIRWNGAAITEALKSCQASASDHGRRGCFVPLWMEPLPPPKAPAQ